MGVPMATIIDTVPISPMGIETKIVGETTRTGTTVVDITTITITIVDKEDRMVTIAHIITTGTMVTETTNAGATTDVTIKETTTITIVVKPIITSGIKIKIEGRPTTDGCQRFKALGRNYGEIPARNDTSIPFEEVAVDMIGPWEVPVQGIGRIMVRALTMIDIASTLSELRRVDNLTAENTAMVFENEWLSRYPRPMRVIHDAGKEFVGMYFQAMLIQNGIKPVPITVKNPQANAVCERLHWTIGNQIRTQVHSNPPTTMGTAYDFIDSVLASAQYAMRAGTHRTMEISPGALVFNRDMMLPIPLLADFHTIRQKRQVIIDEANRRENLKRLFKDYQVGDKVLLKVYNPDKLERRAIGPYIVEQVHTNGTLTIQRGTNVFERINIRRVLPYTE